VPEGTSPGRTAIDVAVPGVVVALLDLEQIASLAVSVLAPRGVELTVRDQSAPPGRQFLELYTSRLHASSDVAQADDTDPTSRDADRYVREIEIGDRRWSVICTSIEGFRSAIIFQRGHWLVLGSGLLFTLLVAAYLLHNKQRLLERLGMEQALQEREDLFWQMTETVENMFFWAVDSQRYDFLYISPGFEKMWGMPCEQVYASSQHYRDAIHPTDREHRDDVLVRARRGKRGAESTYRVRRPDGSIRWVIDFAYPVRDVAGRVFRIVGVTKDITDQRLAEQALRQSEGSLRDLFNRSPDVLATVDTSGLILMLSRSLPGLPSEHAKGQDSAILLPPEWRHWYRGHLEELFHSRKPQHFRYTAEDGTWWEVRMVSVRQDQGVETALVIASDVTEYHRLQEQVLHSARLASLGALAAGVAHEINNPNNAIQFGADLLQRVWRDATPVLDSFVREQGDFSLGGLSYESEGEAVGRVVTDIRNNSERIRRIVDNLKHLVRKETGDMDFAVDLRKVLEEVQMILHSKIRKHTDAFAVDIARDLPRVSGSAQQLEQLFMNLVLNALESLPSRKAGVRVRARPTADRSGVEVEVQDEGVGIRPEDISRLAQPFFTTKTASGGTGLGLSIAAEIVERHGGELSFDSNPGGGTRARVRIPLTRSV
jgi:PAS domain S-box-containing protein